MGIPSYFSHVIKQHNVIIKQPKMLKLVDNLYIDSNSIIYDVIHSEGSINKSFPQIFMEISTKLEYYISIICPTKNVYIAFDGIAPIAKLSQQRTRRIKNTILKNINAKLCGESKTQWDSTQITPGTEFMNSLNKYISDYFSKQDVKYKVMLSLTDEPGEGEHKLFRYIRDNDHKNLNTVIYGLDADLMMLSLLHTKYCQGIYLFRETPDFIKQIDKSLNPSELYLLSITNLKERICQNMTDQNDNHDNIITDYVYICFMLGNDFIPHNPSLNIRTNGIDILIEVYKKLYSSKNFIINNDNSINWKKFKKFCTLLADEETNYLIHEHNIRNKYEKRNIPNSTDEEKLYKLNLLPSINRSGEHYINPSGKGWHSRYYTTLFDVEHSEVRIQQICTNYIEALEWTWKYYSISCQDWRWKYNYDYSPLFSDIIKYIPYHEHDFIKFSSTKNISSLTQLIYVLPQESHYLLPKKVKNILELKFQNWYDKSQIEFKWDYCKYLWEAHLTLPEIDINLIEKTFD
jgi:5'-3' exonuclease